MPAFCRRVRFGERQVLHRCLRETWNHPWAHRVRCFHSAPAVVGASSREISAGSEAIFAPAESTRRVESMSSVSIDPCIRVRASRSVRQ